MERRTQPGQRGLDRLRVSLAERQADGRLRRPGCVLRSTAEFGRDVTGRPACSTAGVPQYSLVITSPQVEPDADRMGLTGRIEAAGGAVPLPACASTEGSQRQGNGGGERLETVGLRTAKLVNIVSSYGYKPALLSMAACIDAAV